MKEKSAYCCSGCGGLFPKWSGQCPDCGDWNSLKETAAASKSAKNQRFSGYAGDVPTPQVLNLSEIEPSLQQGIPTGISELDRVLGGGLVSGSVVLIGGDPGIGKSTLLIQAMARF